MMKIQCAECGRSFIWSDDMPLQGKCPEQDCEWRYDVQEEMKKAAEKKAQAMQKDLVLCPHCQKPLNSRWTLCPHCGDVVVGRLSFSRKHLFILGLTVLVILSLIYRFWS
ncbi:MAG: hypothetical protein JW950_09715 [Deltaproteobacteria bacterium]|nr:hypothetical protein [Deltaproteobacteria bacterium]